jgi:hypothetical protein
MNFFEQQDQARKQSRWLIIIFILAVVAIVAAIDLMILLAVGVTSWDAEAAPMSAWEIGGGDRPGQPVQDSVPAFRRWPGCTFSGGYAGRIRHKRHQAAQAA